MNEGLLGIYLNSVHFSLNKFFGTELESYIPTDFLISLTTMIFGTWFCLALEKNT